MNIVNFSKKVKNKNESIIIYRLGSLGDTIIALPCFHLIKRKFPNAKRYLLTDVPTSNKASHPSAILENSGLIHDYISYSIGLRAPRRIVELHQQLRKIAPDLVIYLQEPRGRIKAFRDAFFFRSCGINKLIGVPYTKELQENKWLSGENCYEYEGNRLARCLSSLGDARLDNPKSWDLHLTAKEKSGVAALLQKVRPAARIIACSLGTKVNVNHWGLINWQKLVKRLYHDYRGSALMFIGAENEFDESEKASRYWAGHQINLCGILSPRESAAAIKKADILIGHDSGPMHLAASVGTPCVAIFSARNKPKVWFPYGNSHRVIYHKTACYGCHLEVCEKKAKKCITSITVEEVKNAVHASLQEVKFRMTS